MDRRKFLSLLSLAAAGGMTAACTSGSAEPRQPSLRQRSLIHIPDGQSVARFPEKEELILLTDRPPQLETPTFYFRQDLTPNEAFFVRWHFAGIPTRVDLRSFRLTVAGHVEKTLSLSLDELKSRFEPAEVVAVVQCSGNSRSSFEPRVAGGQWGNGAVGNARWKGARLKDLLKQAGLKSGALELSFAGLDRPPLSNMPQFAKSLSLEDALADEVLIAYEMNGAQLPMLNGFPLRLVVPGWFATYWVKALNEITVLPSKFDGFWMAKSYRIPNNEFADESPGKLARDTVPITRMNVRSLFVRPDLTDVVKKGQAFVVEGIAFDGGAGIGKVELSFDGGKSWKQATIGSEFGKYSFYRWKYPWTPDIRGTHRIMVKATNLRNESQALTAHWNKSGYMQNVVESLDVMVV